MNGRGQRPLANTSGSRKENLFEGEKALGLGKLEMSAGTAVLTGLARRRSVVGGLTWELFPLSLTLFLSVSLDLSFYETCLSPVPLVSRAP